LKIRCECRKPGTKLFEQACHDLQIDPTNSWMIGDQTRDIEMARRVGLQSILLNTGSGGSDRQFSATPAYIATDLMAASEFVLQQRELISR
jgi:histidinol phosphatase-like enzyme